MTSSPGTWPDLDPPGAFSDARSPAGEPTCDAGRGETSPGGGDAARRKIAGLGEFATDLLIRSVGVIAVGLSASAISWLYRHLHGRSPDTQTIGQYMVAGLAFLGASLGTGLIALGAHVNDRIIVSERWRPRI